MNPYVYFIALEALFDSFDDGYLDDTLCFGKGALMLCLFALQIVFPLPSAATDEGKLATLDFEQEKRVKDQQSETDLWR